MKSKTLFVWILIFCFVGFAFGAPDQADDDEDEDEQEKGPDDNKRNDTEKEDNVSLLTRKDLGLLGC